MGRVRAWWRDLCASLRAMKREEEERRSWRCKQCGKGEDDMRGQAFEGGVLCNWCVALTTMAKEERRKRIAELAALVAGKNPQATYRAADARMTADAAWAIAEEIYRKEHAS